MKKLLLHLSIIIAFATFFTTFIIQIPNPIFDDVGSKDSWINFFGAITGGLLTLYGVWWTINEQKKDLINEQQRIENQRREDLASQYKPILSLEFVNSIISNVPTENSSIIFMFKLSNIGRGEALNIKIQCQQKMHPYYFQIMNSDIPLLVVDKNSPFNIGIIKGGRKLDDEYQELLILDNSEKPAFPISITFTDAFENIYAYKYNLTLTFGTHMDAINVESVDIKDQKPQIVIREQNLSNTPAPSWKANISDPIISTKFKDI